MNHKPYIILKMIRNRDGKGHNNDQMYVRFLLLNTWASKMPFQS